MAVDINASFTYHRPNEQGIKHIERIRDLGWELANAIQYVVGETADGTLAIRKVEEACMWANKALAIKHAN